MDIVLLAGLWLPASTWDDVGEELARLGHRAIAVSLPGVDDGDTDATLDDQVRAVLAAVDAADRPLVVGHSAACTLAWIAADQRPDAIRAVVMIGGFPSESGSAYAEFFPISDGAMAFPGWEPFDGPDADDLDTAARQRIADGAIPVPVGVASGVVRLADDRRFGVPVVLVCPEFDPPQAQSWIDAGDVPELTHVEHLSFVDLDSGHWPMVTCPNELAAIIDSSARGR